MHPPATHTIFHHILHILSIAVLYIISDRGIVHNDLLSLMTITRERQPDYSGWEAGWRCDPRLCE